MHYSDLLTKRLLIRPIKLIQYKDILKSQNTFYDSVELETELLLSNGYPIYLSEDIVYLKTTQNTINEQVFCIVDIETSGGNPKTGQIIELAAYKIQKWNHHRGVSIFGILQRDSSKSPRDHRDNPQYAWRCTKS